MLCSLQKRSQRPPAGVRPKRLASEVDAGASSLYPSAYTPTPLGMHPFIPFPSFPSRPCRHPMYTESRASLPLERQRIMPRHERDSVRKSTEGKGSTKLRRGAKGSQVRKGTEGKGREGTRSRLCTVQAGRCRVVGACFTAPAQGGNGAHPRMFPRLPNEAPARLLRVRDEDSCVVVTGRWLSLTEQGHDFLFEGPAKAARAASEGLSAACISLNSAHLEKKQQ